MKSGHLIICHLSHLIFRLDANRFGIREIVRGDLSRRYQQRSRFTIKYKNSSWNRSVRESVAGVEAELAMARECCCCANSDAVEVAGTAGGDVAAPGLDYTSAWLG